MSTGSILSASSNFKASLKAKRDVFEENIELSKIEAIQGANKLYEAGSTSTAIEAYLQFILSPLPSSSSAIDAARGLKEAAIYKATCMLPQKADSLAQFIRALEPIWVAFPRAKTAKIIKDILTVFDKMEDPSEVQNQLLKELIDWASRDNRVFLKQSLELKLAELYLIQRKFTESLALTQELLKHFRRLDDKMSILQTELLISRTYFALKNISKSRAALTAARTAANAIYCPPLVLAAIDLQTGLLHAEETDFGTAFSYFVEALDNYILAEVNPKGATALKYMLLCKIMLGKAAELDSLLKSKSAKNYEIGREIEAMQAIGNAYQEKSVRELEKALDSYPDAIGFDPIIQSHFASLYDKLLEQNIIKIIGPFERILISSIAKQLGLGEAVVEAKLGQMIIDKIFCGVIDQSGGYIQIVPVLHKDEAFEQALLTLDHLSHAVTALYELYQSKIKRLNQIEEEKK